jgi:hypothetical protein
LTAAVGSFLVICFEVVVADAAQFAAHILVVQKLGRQCGEMVIFHTNYSKDVEVYRRSSKAIVVMICCGFALEEEDMEGLSK